MKDIVMKREVKYYKPLLGLRETEKASSLIKRFFKDRLAQKLNLMEVAAPLFVDPKTGLNDDLNGVERPVSFMMKSIPDVKGEVVHSLAKWKRLALARYDFKTGEGLYTDMKAIRADEDLDSIHSLFVDQFDWERVITKEDRTIEFLKSIVCKIYETILETEALVGQKYPKIECVLPETIHFIHTEELAELYPTLTPKEREHELCKKYGAVFLIGIGADLAEGGPHDGRAPDYDDWTTETDKGFKGLNGDILVWNPVLEASFELSSMGIRVDKKALMLQLKIRNCQERATRMFHKLLLEDKLPLSIGGGIGLSRLCMLLLRKMHIGEISPSIWSEHARRELGDLEEHLL